MTNVFFQPADPTHTCKKCGETKALTLFVPSRNAAIGYRSLCKACKNVQQLATRQRRAAEAVARVQATRVEREADPTITPPRNYVGHTGKWVPPAEGYVRNNGNKHIPSKGV